MQTLQELQARQRSLQANPDDERFPGELATFNGVLGWLADFTAKLTSGSPTDVVHSLVQMGIEDPHHTNHFDDFDAGEPTNSWVKMYKWQYNTAIWEVITNHEGLLPKLRRVLLADMKFEGSDLGPEWGKIVIKAYAQALLDYFLQPKGAAWCITKHWQTQQVLEKLPKLSA